MFEIKLLGKYPSNKSEFWRNLPKEIRLIELEEIPAQSFYFVYEENRLTLAWSLKELEGLSPLSFDWEQTIAALRKSLKAPKEESLYKGLALSKEKHPKVADATLGTGKDALLMRLLGAQVYAYERNPWIFLLALDAYERLSNKEGLSLFFGEVESSYPFIYFDPMFPEKKKSALPPKEMQIFKFLVGEDVDQAERAQKLKDLSEKRLLIKRPGWAEPLLSKPHMNYETKLMRLDAYVK